MRVFSLLEYKYFFVPRLLEENRGHRNRGPFPRVRPSVRPQTLTKNLNVANNFSQPSRILTKLSILTPKAVMRGTCGPLRSIFLLVFPNRLKYDYCSLISNLAGNQDLSLLKYLQTYIR